MSELGLFIDPLPSYVGTNEDCTIFLKAFFAHCESSIDVAPSQAFFLRKRRELGPLCHRMPSWICVNTVTPCSGVINPEGAQAHTIHSSQTLTFHMMLATKHHFHSIQERANVFIPLEFTWPATTHCLPMPMVQSQLRVKPTIKYQPLLLPQNV